MDESIFDAMADVYDEMITWEPRLKRELPLIREVFTGKKHLLEIGSATGRHAIALSDEFKVTGLDINKQMVEFATEAAAENKNVKFIYGKTDDLDLSKYDGVYLLANTLSNFENRENIIALLKQLRSAMPDGTIFGQSVILRDSIYYLPLRRVEDRDITVQRIMMPGSIRGSTHLLHFNILQKGNYLKQDRIPLYGMTVDILKEIAEETGWNIDAIYGSYAKDQVINEAGKPFIWILT